MGKRISHSGIIEAVNEKSVTVRILQESACGTCKVAGHCNASESKEKLIEIADSTGQYAIGQQVTVSAPLQTEWKALMIGYIVPLIILAGVLAAVLLIFGQEPLAALCSIAALAVYYFMVYLLRGKINKTIQFEINKN